MHRVATSVIEVRDGSVKNYFGDYDSYQQSIESEVDEGERERAVQTKTGVAKDLAPKSKATDYRQSQRDQRKTEKEIKNLEKKIARLDDERKQINEKLLKETDPDEAVRLHEQVSAIGDQLAEAEERWMELSDFS